MTALLAIGTLTHVVRIVQMLLFSTSITLALRQAAIIVICRQKVPTSQKLSMLS